MRWRGRNEANTGGVEIFLTRHKINPGRDRLLVSGDELEGLIKEDVTSRLQDREGAGEGGVRSWSGKGVE